MPEGLVSSLLGYALFSSLKYIEYKVVHTYTYVGEYSTGQWSPEYPGQHICGMCRQGEWDYTFI